MVIVLLIILYSLTFIILFDRYTKHSQTRLSRKEIVFAFSFKVAMGLLYGFVFKEFYGGDDTWKYFNDSLTEYNKLLFQTKTFFKEVIPLDSFQKYPDFANGFRDLLENLEYNALTKSLAFFNLLSFQNYYVDVIFFNLFSFFGCYLLFKLFANTWQEKRALIYITVFFIPPVTFWLSGIRTDGLLVLSLGLSLYYFQAWMHTHKWQHLICFLVGLVGTLVFRVQFFLVLLPFLFAWGLVLKFSFKPQVAFTGVFILGLILFFGSGFISPKLDLTSIVVAKQHEFLALKGNTVFELKRLEPHFFSFVATLPQAALNSYFRPFPWEARGFLQLAASVEMLFFWLIVLLGIRRVYREKHHPLPWFVLFFGTCTYLLIGFTVPFPGAIIRYKIIPELFYFLLFLPCLPIKLKKINI